VFIFSHLSVDRELLVQLSRKLNCVECYVRTVLWHINSACACVCVCYRKDKKFSWVMDPTPVDEELISFALKFLSRRKLVLLLNRGIHDSQRQYTGSST